MVWMAPRSTAHGTAVRLTIVGGYRYIHQKLNTGTCRHPHTYRQTHTPTDLPTDISTSLRCAGDEENPPGARRLAADHAATAAPPVSRTAPVSVNGTFGGSQRCILARAILGAAVILSDCTLANRMPCNLLLPDLTSTPRRLGLYQFFREPVGDVGDAKRQVVYLTMLRAAFLFSKKLEGFVLGTDGGKLLAGDVR